MPSQARGQCAVCGNPAFVPDDNDVGRLLNLADPSPKRRADSGPTARVALIYAVQRYADIYTGTDKLSDADKGAFMFTPDWLLQVQLATLVAEAGLPTGTSLALTLPMAVASADRPPDEGPGTATDSAGNPLTTVRDRGLSDVEVRVRQRLDVPLRASLRRLAPSISPPRVVLSMGAVAPTGAFIPKDPSGNLPEGYASLGRGVWWALAALELGGDLGQRFGWSVGVATRTPLTTISHNGFLFRWGGELRARAMLTVRALGDLLAFGAGAVWQRRGTGQERVFAESDPEDFQNGGGESLTALPALRVRVGPGLSATIAARVPLWREVNGHQPVPGIGASLGLGWRM